jgi:hypothetical protein
MVSSAGATPCCPGYGGSSLLDGLASVLTFIPRAILDTLRPPPYIRSDLGNPDCVVSLQNCPCTSDDPDIDVETKAIVT